MIALEYGVGSTGWMLLVRGANVLAIDVEPNDPRTAELWIDLAQDPSPSLVLDRLASGGLARVPSFALLHLADVTWTAIVRGNARVTLRSDASESVVDGGRSATWSELAVDHAHGWEVAVEATEPTVGAVLPLVQGIVRAGWFRWSADDEDDLESTRFREVGGAASPVAAERPTSVPRRSAAVPAEEETQEEAAPDAEESVPSATAVETPSRSSSDLHDELFGATISRSVESAAVRPTAAPEEPGADDEDSGSDAGTAPTSDSASDPRAGASVDPIGPPDSGEQTMAPFLDPEDADSDGAAGEDDHDGLTIALSELGALRPEPEDASEPVLHAGAPPSSTAPVLRSFAGEVIVLDRPVVIGRSPTVTTPMPPSELPHLVTVPGPTTDVSRNHVHAAVEGGVVVVVDMHSRNGTLVTLPGRSPVRLRPGEPTPIIPGTIIDLGGGATYVVDVP